MVVLFNTIAGKPGRQKIKRKILNPDDQPLSQPTRYNLACSVDNTE